MTRILVGIIIGSSILAGVLTFRASSGEKAKQAPATRALAQSAPASASLPKNIPVASSDSLLSDELYALSRNPKRTDFEVFALVESISAADGPLLQAKALDTKKSSHEERFLAVFLMAQKPQAFAQQLKNFATAKDPLLLAKPKPHTMGEITKHFELTLRTQAIIALEKTNPGEDFFREQRNKGLGPFLDKILLVAAEGARRGGDPLVERFMNAKLEGGSYEIGN